MNDSEAIAAEVIEQLILGAAMKYRRQQSRGEYDFDLISRDGKIVPLEVTESKIKTYQETTAAIRNKRKGGFFINLNKCRQGWYIFPAVDVRVDMVREHVDAYLADIEAEGLSGFFSSLDASRSKAVKRIYEDLRIEGGSVFDWKEPGIGIALPTQAAPVSGHDFEQAIESEANKLDNLRKLGSATNADEHHLLIYIDHDNFPVWFAMNLNQPSAQKPALPGEISHIWAVASSRWPNQYIVWRASSSEQWRVVGIAHVTPNEIQGRIAHSMDD